MRSVEGKSSEFDRRQNLRLEDDCAVVSWRFQVYCEVNESVRTLLCDASRGCLLQTFWLISDMNASDAIAKCVNGADMEEDTYSFARLMRCGKGCANHWVWLHHHCNLYQH